MVKIYYYIISFLHVNKGYSSSGTTQRNSPLPNFKPSNNPNRSVQMPIGECQLNDMVFSSDGSLICIAATDRVRVWDSRK